MAVLDLLEILGHLGQAMQQFPLVQYLTRIRIVDAQYDRLFVHTHTDSNGSFRCGRICVVLHRFILGWLIGYFMRM